MQSLTILFTSCYIVVVTKISVFNLPPTPHALPLSWSTHFIRQQFTNKTVFLKNGDEHRTFRGFRETNFHLDFSASDPFKTGKWNLGNLWNTPVKTVMLRYNESQEEKISWSERDFLLFSLFPSSPARFLFFSIFAIFLGIPSRSLCGGESLPTISKFRKKKENLVKACLRPPQNVACTQTLFSFSFRSFRARERKNKDLFSSSPTTMPVLAIGIVRDCFYLLIFYSEIFPSWVWRLPYFLRNTRGARKDYLRHRHSKPSVKSVCELVRNIVFESCRVSRTFVGVFNWPVSNAVCD